MEIKNKKIILRADFNVPIKNGIVEDDYRIVSTIPTLDFLKKNDVKTIIISHIETSDIEKPTLKPVFDYIKNNYPEYDIDFIEDVTNMLYIEKKLESMNYGSFLLLENIRYISDEKNNGIDTAIFFKKITDMYINDAFAVSHREHMSVSVLPSLYEKENKMFGFQMKKEIDSLSKILSPNKPFAVILSGSKFSTKLPLIEKYLNTANNLFIGGALFNNILKSLGYNVGKSLIDIDADLSNLVKLDSFIQKVFIPKKVIVKNLNTNNIRVCEIDNVDIDESIQDIADESINEFVEIIKNNKTKTIVWNGPLGYYENDDFKKGTLTMAKGLIDYVEMNTEAYIFIGGGDTVNAIKSMNTDNDRIFISTGGGAMLEFLEKDGNLPGVVSME